MRQRRSDSNFRTRGWSLACAAMLLASTLAVAQTATPPNASPATQPMTAETAARIDAIRRDAASFETRAIGGSVQAPRAGIADGVEAGATTQPAIGKAGGTFGPIMRVFAALAIVIGLIVAARVLFKQFFVGANAPASKTIKVIGRTSLAPRQQVLLLQIGGRIVVVGESGGNLSTLAQIEDPDEVARLLGQLQEEQINKAASFGGLFGRMQRKYDETELTPETGVELPGGDGTPGPRNQAAALEEEQQLVQAKSELSGLVDKVRALRSQMGQ